MDKAKEIYLNLKKLLDKYGDLDLALSKCGCEHFIGDADDESLVRTIRYYISLWNDESRIGVTVDYDCDLYTYDIASFFDMYDIQTGKYIGGCEM